MVDALFFLGGGTNMVFIFIDLNLLCGNLNTKFMTEIAPRF